MPTPRLLGPRFGWSQPPALTEPMADPLQSNDAHDAAIVKWLLAKAIDHADQSEGVEEAMKSVVDSHAAVLRASRRERLTQALIAEARGLGAIERLMLDPAVSEVMVNGPDEIWVERGGRLEPAPFQFRSKAALREAIDRLLAAAGRRVDDTTPMADARMPDGSRLNVVLPPLSGSCPTMTIRRFSADLLSVADLVQLRTLSSKDSVLLQEAVLAGRNILICGATGSGKSTTLAALASEIPASQRLITIEDTAELRINHPHVVGLETRPAGSGGRGGVTMRDLVRNALRMRPDRLIIGEVRGGEALDMIDALSTGHRGSLSTVHAASATGALIRLEQLALQAASGLSEKSIRVRVRAAIDFVVVQERVADGRRVITEIHEVHDEGTKESSIG